MSLDIDLHGRRTAWLTARVCQEMGMTGREMLDTALAAATHDVGKLDLAQDLLLKPASLTDEERTTIQRHCLLGARRLIAASCEDTPDSTTLAVAVALSHHEWWDGRGYPFGLSGRAIPRGARIAAAADVFDALTSARPYKPAWPIRDAIDHIACGSGRQFEPEVAEAMVAVARTLPGDWKVRAEDWTHGAHALRDDGGPGRGRLGGETQRGGPFGPRRIVQSCRKCDVFDCRHL